MSNLNAAFNWHLGKERGVGGGTIRKHLATVRAGCFLVNIPALK